MCNLYHQPVGQIQRYRDVTRVSRYTATRKTEARRVHPCRTYLRPERTMSERAFWPSNPDALLTSAAQAVEAKNGLGRFLGRSWDYVDAHLAEVLLVTLERLPEAGRLRRESDRMILRWVGRLIDEVPKDDAFRPKILRHFRSKLAKD